MEDDFKGCRNVIAGILIQAFLDSFSRNRNDDSEGAKRFINHRNPLFITYCELLDLNPEYVAEHMQSLMRKGIKKFKLSEILD